jgi:hypothetical protein
MVPSLLGESNERASAGVILLMAKLFVLQYPQHKWLRSDLISAIRQARRAPVATAAVLASLALGIGANTAIFSLLNAQLLSPLPVRAPEALVSLRTVTRSSFDTGVSVPEFDALAKAEAGQPARWVNGLFVSGDDFDVVGVAPVRGRLLARGDNDRTAPAAVVVRSGGFWRSAFGAAPDVVGRTLTIQGQPLEIVGVADPGFFGLEVGQAFDVAVPVSLYAPLFEAPERVQNARLPWLSVVGRLPPGQPLQQAAAVWRGAQAGVMRQAGLPPNSEAARLKAPWDPPELRQRRGLPCHGHPTAGTGRLGADAARGSPGPGRGPARGLGDADDAWDGVEARVEAHDAHNLTTFHHGRVQRVPRRQHLSLEDDGLRA